MKRIKVCLILISALCALLVGCGSEESMTENPKTTATSSTMNTTQTTGSTEPKILSEEEVKSFALFCAGTTEKKVTNYQCKLTYHEERDCQVYEISFDVGRTHYKYVFRATDCDIIENTKEIGDK